MSLTVRTSPLAKLARGDVLDNIVEHWLGADPAVPRARTPYSGLTVDRWSPPSSIHLLLSRAAFELGAAWVHHVADDEVSEPRHSLCSVTERIHHERECWRRLAATRVVEVKAGTRRAPVRENVHEAAVLKGRLHHVTRKVGETHPVQGRLPDRRHGVERDPAMDADVEVLTVLAEIPGEEATMVGRRRLMQA